MTEIGGSAMRITAVLVTAIAFAQGTLAAQNVTVKTLLTKAMTAAPGKELLMIAQLSSR
jgi:hypothetical protein